MKELIEKVEKLKLELDKDIRIIRINELNKKLKDNPDLIKKIKEYHLTRKESLKEEIINNNLFKEYKKAETDINLLILEINQKLKQISKKGQCQI